MKRDQALQDLSRDHMFALRLAHHMEQAARGFEGAPSIADAAAAILNAWDDDLFWHFREEEEVFLPLLSRHGEVTGRPEVAVMLDDHAWLREAFESLRIGIASGSPNLELAVAVGRRLHAHVRHEERSLFPMIEATLSAAELDLARVRSEAFRRVWRSDDVVGPFRTHG